MTDKEIEDLAIRAAKGNNGGEWATHYTETEAQKAYWRQWVRDMGAKAYARGLKAGYEKGRDIHAQAAPDDTKSTNIH